MITVEYHLYRVKFIQPKQLDFFAKEISASDLFLRVLSEKPAIALMRENVWHIGNIEYFNEMTGSFAIGRTTKTTVERYDVKTGNFIEELDDSGPYTYVLFDRSIGLLGIAKKSRVAADVEAIARKIKALFEIAVIVKELGVEVKVSVIPDPEDFIFKIRHAYSIKSFRAFFTGPNPVDADEIFQKPLSVYCRELNGDHGSVEVVGDSLNEDAVEAVAKSTAATGNTAAAKIQAKRGGKTIIIKMKGDAVRVPLNSEVSREQALEELQAAYYRVRK